MNETDLKKRDLLKTLPLAPVALVGMTPKESSAAALQVLATVNLILGAALGAIQIFKTGLELWNEFRNKENANPDGVSVSERKLELWNEFRNKENGDKDSISREGFILFISDIKDQDRMKSIQNTLLQHEGAMDKKIDYIEVVEVVTRGDREQTVILFRLGDEIYISPPAPRPE